MVLLSAAMVLLSKYSGQDEIVIGCPVSARTHRDTESMMGMFVNTLAIKGVLSGEKQYDSFLREIKDKCLQAYNNQDYSYEKLVEEVNVGRDASRSPLFNVSFILHNNENVDIKFNNVLTEYISEGCSHTKFNMSYKIVEQDKKYHVYLEYFSELYSEETAQNLLGHYMTVLEQVVEDSGMRIREIEVITQEERKLILNEFNNTHKDYDRSKTILDLFEEQTLKTPGNTAVMYGDKEICYQELNLLANRLAWRLREVGVGANDFVCMHVPRSVEMLIGLYGVMKAGGAYVPIGTDYPDVRIERIINDCKPKAILTCGVELKTSMPVLDLMSDASYAQINDNPERVHGTEDYIFCTYTSGTTAVPKGIPVRHRNIMNLAVWYRDAFEFKEHDRVMLMAPLGFDLTQRNIFGPHITGAAVCLCGDENVYDANEFADYIKAYEVTIINCAASAFYAMLAADIHAGYARLAPLKHVYLVGEPLIYAKINDYLESPRRNARVVNGYGATED
jgi:surfactin family lipopeptide synthetase A